MNYHGNGSWPGEWTLRLYPNPPRDLSWLDLSTTPGEPAARVRLTPVGRPVVTISPWSENRCEISGLEEAKTRFVCHISPVHRLEGVAALHNYLASIFTASGRPGRERFQ